MILLEQIILEVLKVGWEVDYKETTAINGKNGLKDLEWIYLIR